MMEYHFEIRENELLGARKTFVRFSPSSGDKNHRTSTEKDTEIVTDDTNSTEIVTDDTNSTEIVTDDTNSTETDHTIPTRRKSWVCYKKVAPLWTALLLQESRPADVDPDKDKKHNIGGHSFPAAMLDQGNHEVEVTPEGFEASHRWKTCVKNVGHAGFIQPEDFSLQDLPTSHRDDDIYSFIKLWSQLVVKITVSNISMNRPEGYPFYSIRGHHVPITGSGKVTDITTVQDSPCLCKECAQSDSPKQIWIAVWIMTAMHVLFDDMEATHAHVELFYDDPDSKDGVTRLGGVRVVDHNMKGDWCKFECATHDLDLGARLESIDKQALEVGHRIQEKHMAQNFQPLAVIASHPHGSSKFITVGEWRDRVMCQDMEENYEWSEYSYTTSTCTGCSGAPVWIIGPNRIHYLYNYYSHVHSEAIQGGLNKSGAGDVEKRWDMR